MTMKKILILTTSTGEGHNQAANAISNSFKKSGYEVMLHDFLKNNSKALSKLFISGYDLSAAVFPSAYGSLYKVSDTDFTNKLLSALFHTTKKKISSLINSFEPDVILATHPFAVSILGSLKGKGLTKPVIVIVTDFKPHSTYINDNVDAYVTASQSTANELVKCGIKHNKIYTFGIPIKDEFSTFKSDIKSLKNDEYFNILLMGGSMGLKNISHVVYELLNNSNKLRITVVCGKNEKLKQELLEKYKAPIQNKKLHILGFSKDIDSLMDYSDLIISKPGGLTVTEAITKNLPILIPFAIPGQEFDNVDFLTKNGYALYVDSLSKINPCIDDLILNPEELNDMRKRLSELSANYSKENIVKLANELIKTDDY